MGSVTHAKRRKAGDSEPGHAARARPGHGAGAPAGMPLFLKSAPQARGEPIEPLEREADAFAEAVAARAPGDGTAATAAPPTAPGGAATPPGLPKLPPGRGSAASAPGRPLPRGLRRSLEPSLGVDLGAVRVHDDARAAQWNRSLSANAFTVGSNVYFSAGSYRPDTASGRRLIAHEVAHAAQQRPFVLRNGDESVDPLDEPADCQIGVSLAGVELLPVGEPVFQPVPPREEQIMAMLLRKIAPDRYRRDLPAQAIAHLNATGGYTFTTPPTPEGEVPRVLRTTIDLSVSYRIVDWLVRTVGREGEPYSDWLHLTAQQIELLELGVDVEVMWEDFQNPRFADLWSGAFPPWYGFALFRTDLQSHGAVLREYHAERVSYLDAGGQDNTALVLAQNRVMLALQPAVEVLDHIRREPLLFGDPTFRVLWDLPPLPEGTPPEQADGPSDTQVPGPGAVMCLRFIRTQPGLRDAVFAAEGGDPPPTVELFTRFVRFLGRSYMTERIGDQQLSDRPTDRNADPLPANISAYPALEPPLFDAALGTDHSFVLDVSFSDVYEHLANAFGGFLYRWELIEVPGGSLDAVEETAASAPGTGTEPGWADVWGARMRRQGRYALADVERVADAMDPIEATGTARDIQRLVHLLGAPFVGPTSLVGVNAAIRAVGEVISTYFDMVTEPRNEKHIVFPHAGLWIVRGFCAPNLTDDSEFRRATSVAWIPAFARSPEQMARMRLEQQIGRDLQGEITLADVLLRLEQKDECDEEWDQLVRSRDALQTELYGSVGDVLQQQRAAFDQRLRTEPSLDEATRRTLEQAIERIDDQLETRASRDARSGTDRLLDAGAFAAGLASPSLGPLTSLAPLARPLFTGGGEGGRLARAERIRAVFVTDTGTVVRPLIEGVSTEDGDRFEYYVSDSTGPNSGDATSHGNTRADAMMSALTSLFESAAGYGRGELQVYIPSAEDPSVGEIRHQRIEADLAAIGVETIENITLVVTIAAMVAAPFTGGASLAILVPVGVVGALPSAYRLLDRAESATLRWDTQTILDLLNIVASAAGAGSEVAGGLRAVRLQRFLGVLGTGVDGLTMVAVSYQMVEEMSAIYADTSLSEGQRRAAIMRLFGSQAQMIGMQAAGRLLGHADMLSRTSEGTAPPHLDGPAADAPGVHPGEGTARADEPGTSRATGEPGTSGAAGEPGMTSAADAPEPIRRRNLAFEEHLPPDLRGRVTVESDSSFTGRTTEVQYTTDSWGMVTEVVIRHGPDADATDIALHASTARQLHALTRLTGRIRTLLNRFLVWVGLPGGPPPGTVAFDAMMEVRKLPEVIRARQADIEARGMTDEGLAAEMDSLKAQLRAYEAIYAEYRFTGDAGGAGDQSIGARSPHDWLRRELQARRGTRGELRTIPERWTGAHEAAWLRYPPAEPGYQWRLTLESDGPRLTYGRSQIGEGADARPARAYDAVNGRFVDVGEAPLSRVSTDAIRDGYPPPPEGHYYIRRDEGYELRRSETEGVAAMEVYEVEPGVWGIRPRTDGDLPLIGRQPYRTDLEVGETSRADLELDDAFNAAIARRDQAIADRQTAEAGLPAEPDPSDVEAHRAWHDSPEMVAYRQLRNQVGLGSRDAGAVAADIHVRRTWEGAVRIHPPEGVDLATAGSRSGDFDLVYQVGNLYIVVEAKGGASPIGSRRVEGGFRAEQGTREYFGDVRDNMAELDGSARDAGRALRRAPLENIVYLHTELQLVTVDGRTEVRGLRVRPFDISQPGVRPQP